MGLAGSPTPSHDAQPTLAAVDRGLDGLVAAGRAIGVRVVLDLTAPPVNHDQDPIPLVVVPDSAALLLEGFPTYGS
jgi:hypothetical protein